MIQVLSGDWVLEFVSSPVIVSNTGQRCSGDAVLGLQLYQYLVAPCSVLHGALWKQQILGASAGQNCQIRFAFQSAWPAPFASLGSYTRKFKLLFWLGNVLWLRHIVQACTTLCSCLWFFGQMCFCISPGCPGQHYLNLESCVSICV